MTITNLTSNEKEKTKNIKKKEDGEIFVEINIIKDKYSHFQSLCEESIKKEQDENNFFPVAQIIASVSESIKDEESKKYYKNIKKSIENKKLSMLSNPIASMTTSY